MDKPATSQKEKILLKIRQASDLPAMADTVNLINKFKSSVDSSVSDLANIILKDYALTTKVLKVVNSVHYMQSGQVTTISRGIFLMGVDSIKNIALTLMLFDQLQKHSSQTEIMDTIIQAFCGGVIAQKIVEDLNYVESEEAFICALLHPLGKIIVAHTMPEKIAEIKKMSIEQNISENAASAAVLGVSFEEIGTTIATEWNYPQKIVRSMQNASGAGKKDPEDEDGKLGMIATLSTEMSQVLATESEKVDKTTKMKQLLTSYQDHIPASHKNIDRLIGTSIQDFSKLASVLNLNLKKSKLNTQMEKWSETTESSATDTAVLSFMTDSLKTIDTLFQIEEDNPDSIFSKGIQDINNSMLGAFALNDIIRIALETTYRGMKTAQVLRVLFFVRDVKNPLMEIRLGFGNDINEAKKWFQIHIGDFADVFNISVSKDTDLIIRDTEAPDIKKFIPAWYRANRQSTAYLILLPVSVNQKNIGLICIEGESKGFQTISRGYLNYLRILRDQIVIATRQSLRPDSRPAANH